MAETLQNAAARLERRARELAIAELRRKPGDYSKSAMAPAAELVHALCDAQHVFDELLMEKQREYGVRVSG